MKVSRPLRKALMAMAISLPVAIAPLASALPVIHVEDKPAVSPPPQGEPEGEGHEGGGHEGGSRIDDMGEREILPIVFVIGAISIAAFLAYRVGRRRGSSSNS